jgi:hypothetical protein
MLRDQALLAAGLLVERLGGPPVKPYQPEGLWEEKSGKTYQQDHGEALWRRSLYTFWRSTSPPPSMTIFDAATREVCVARRQSTSTPIQALVLENDPTFFEAARALATRALAEGGTTDDARITYAFRLLAGLRPTPAELDILRSLLESTRADFAVKPAEADRVLSVGEAPVPAGCDRIEAAALTLVCSTLQSYDPAVMLR